MREDLEEMPLFPLNAVLFPYAQIQLHVFEERYREMVRRCLDEDIAFGIVLIRDGQEVGELADPYLVGTAVRLVDVQRHDDGRMDIRVQGERRFRIRRFDTSRPYLVGWVEPLVEMEVDDTPRTDALVMRAREYVEAYIEHFFSRFDVRIATVKMPSDPTALSFVIASFLQIENLHKQRLLETTDTVERIADMIPILEQHVLEAKSPSVVKLDQAQLEEWIHPN